LRPASQCRAPEREIRNDLIVIIRTEGIASLERRKQEEGRPDPPSPERYLPEMKSRAQDIKGGYAAIGVNPIRSVWVRITPFYVT